MSSDPESYSESSQRNSDSEYSGSEVRTRPLRQRRRQNNVPREEVPKRTLRPRKEFTPVVDDDEISEENQSVEETTAKQKVLNVLTPPVASIHSRRIEAGMTYYFVRHQSNSFHQCKWTEESELLRLDPLLKPKLKRFDNLFNQDLTFGLDFHMINYDPQNYEVDRIVNSSEVFLFTHPKKSAEIKGKYGEDLLKIVRTLAAFKHDDIKYGAFYIDLSALYAENTQITDNLLDISIIINRVYLDYYTTAAMFWSDLGAMFKNIDLICQNLDKRSDLGKLNQRMKFVAYCLYEDWFRISDLQKQSLEKFKLIWTQGDSFSNFKDEIKRIVHRYEDEGISAGQILSVVEEIFSTYKDALTYKECDSDAFYEEASAMISTLRNKLAESDKNSLIEIHGNKFNNSNSNIRSEQTALHTSTKDNLESESDERAEAGQPLHDLNQPDIEETEKDISTPQLLKSDVKQNEGARYSPSLIYDQARLKDSSLEIKALVETLLNKIKARLTHYESLNENLSNGAFIKFISSVEKSLSWLEAFNPNDEIQSNWISLDDSKLKINHGCGIMFRVKWCNLSYAETTWEVETDIADWDNIIKGYKRFTRAADREARKNYLFKFQKFIELRELYGNPKKLCKTSPSYISDLKRKIFAYKDSKNMIQYNQKTQPIFRDGRILRSYQLLSLNWMIEAWTRRRNIILADEMGLGKTIQAMAFLNHLIVIEQAPGPYLVIAPLSTLAHWKRVFEDWTHLNALLYYDINGKSGRESCREYEFYHWDITMKGVFVKNSKIPKFQVLITSFEVFIQDFESVFVEIPFQHIIIDEAHRLKNKNAKILSILNRLVCKRILLLTGTPIQNNISELWSLLNFIEPNTFNNLEAFQNEFGEQMSIEGLRKLKQVLEPYLLRRMKEEVESSIPPLTETIIDVELTHIQKIVYKTLYEKNKGTLQKGLGMNCISIMNNLEMQLRKCCNHPFLIAEIKQDIVKDCYTWDKYYEKMISSSGKMIFLDKALEKFKNENKKVLVFSQFTEMLKVIEEYLASKSIKYQKIDGGTKAKDRQTAIDRFNNNQGSFEVFLLSTKAGGLGINLTSASIVIIYDSDWNPQNDVQAIARAHRIGQTEEVKVFRLISKKTYESEMFERASKKLGLDQAILLANNFSNKKSEEVVKDEMTKLKPEEIEVLLRKGMVGLLNTDENEGEEQFAQNVDDIIQNARIANYSVANGSYSFNKTRFMGNEKEAMIQIDDPDFWKKVFIDQKSAADNLEKEYKAWSLSDKPVSVEAQKAYFIKLAAEIYQYLEDRVKNEAFSADTELKFNEILVCLMNDIKLNAGIKELVEQLYQDFMKKSRRLKKIDEKTINQVLKSHSNAAAINKRKSKEPASAPAPQPSRAKDDNLKSKSITNGKPAKEGVLGKREKIVEVKEENDVFSESSEEVYQIKKKAKKEEKPKSCDMCGQGKVDINCNGACQRSMHQSCLQNRVYSYLADKVRASANNADHDSPVDNSTQLNQKEAKNVMVDSACYFCHKNIAECFECKKIGFITGDKNEFESEKDKDAVRQLVLKCSICPKFYHYRCLPSRSKNLKDPFKCNHHYCTNCGEFSKKLYKCVECTLGFHRKCMSKKNKALDEYYILCCKHFKANPKTSTAGLQEKSYEKVLNNKKKSLIQSLKLEQTKASKVSSNKSKNKKVKESTDFYEKINIEPPKNFDFANYKKVI